MHENSRKELHVVDSIIPCQQRSAHRVRRNKCTCGGTVQPWPSIQKPEFTLNLQVCFNVPRSCRCSFQLARDGSTETNICSYWDAQAVDFIQWASIWNQHTTVRVSRLSPFHAKGFLGCYECERSVILSQISQLLPFGCAISQKTITIPPSARLFLGHDWHIHLDLLQPNARTTVVANQSSQNSHMTTRPDLIYYLWVVSLS